MNSRIHIEAALVNGASVLSSHYSNAPYLLRNITAMGNRNLQFMLTSSSPGMLDGDSLDVSIRLGSGSSLQLESQAYQRVFPSQQGCRQQQRIKLEAGSRLSYVPHPLVPHYASAFSCSTCIELHPEASLVWGEITASGRHLKDRRYRLLRLLTEVYREDVLLLRELVHFEPEKMVMEDLGLLGGFTHQGSLLIMCPELPDIAMLLAEVPAGLRAAVTAVPGGLMVRALSCGGECMFDFFKSIEHAVWL